MNIVGCETKVDKVHSAALEAVFTRIVVDTLGELVRKSYEKVVKFEVVVNVAGTVYALQNVKELEA